MPLRRLLPFLLPFVLFACGPEPDPTTAAAPEATEPPAASGAAAFRANPQPVAEREVATLAVGQPAPDFRLMGVDGRYRTLADYAGAEALLLVFTANHCPTAQAYEQRLIDYTADYRDRGVQVVAISPNSPLGLLYNELGYTDLGDEYDEMIVRHRDAGYNFPYLYDGDDHAASLRYGPVATPHVFLFDADRRLAYTGRLDKVERPGTANAEDLRAATDAVLAGRTPPEPTTKTFGCSTKWAWKTAYKQQVEEEWLAQDVDLQPLDLAAAEDLLANDSDELRLINFWATWCGPCVQEYPDFLITHRMYGDRAFGFVSVTMDNPDRGPAALKFLQKVHSPVPNYHWTGADKYALIEAVDPAWNGALPYTVLLAPGGEVVWRQQGTVDFLDLRRAIVEHELLGRYF